MRINHWSMATLGQLLMFFYALIIFAAVGISVLVIKTPARIKDQQPDAEKQQKIIRAVTANEAKFRQKLNNYSFNRDATIYRRGNIELEMLMGVYHRVSSFVFDDNGRRYEKILDFPAPTGGLDQIVTPEDLDDLGGIQPFALETSKMDLYNYIYVAKEHIDELDCYVFDVAPKVIPDAKKTKERFFKGRIWVETEGLQIVKTMGQALPETDKNKFPIFETYRENIDGRYWFPTYTHAAPQVLYYPNSALGIEMIVKYSDFKEFKGKVKIIEVDGPVPIESPTPKPTPTP